MIKYFIYRFPILLLCFTTLSIIVSVFSLFQVSYDYLFLYLSTGLIFLFHIRVVDDYRDFDHDTKYYNERELQKGKLSIRSLFMSAEILVVTILLLNVFYLSLASASFLFLGWINSLLSIHYFGYGKKIEENYMILYHILNNFTLNMFFLYLYFSGGVFENHSIFLILLHLIFLNLLVFLLEITRKIQSHDEKKIPDTYISKYGYKKNFYLIMGVIIIIFVIIHYFFYWLKIDYQSIRYILYSIIFLTLLILNILHHTFKTKKYKNGVLFFSLIFYLYSGFYFFYF